MTIKGVKPKKFQVRLANCGTNTFSVNYKKIENENALKLAFNINDIMLKDFVGEQHYLNLKYELACMLLDSLEGWKEQDLLKDIKNAEKFFNNWKLKHEKK